MRSLLLIVALLLPFQANAEKLENIDAAVAVTDQIMNRVSSGDMKGGFELAKPHMVIPGAELDAILGQVELQLPVFAARYGKSIGYEQLRNDSIGSSLAQVVYIQRFEKHALVWRFTLYRGANGWTINTFKYADEITVLF